MQLYSLKCTIEFVFLKNRVIFESTYVVIRLLRAPIVMTWQKGAEPQPLLFLFYASDCISTKLW